MARTIGSVGAETAENVQRAALSLFAQHGYAAVSMRQIAGQIGLQAGAIYNHFQTKQAILKAIMIAHLDGLIAAYKQVPESPNAHAELETFVRFHIRYHVGKPEEVFIAYMELRSLEPTSYREVMSLRQQYERYLRDIVRRGVSQGDFAVTDISVTTMAVIAMLTGVNTWFRYGGRLGVVEIEEIYVKMVMRCVGISGVMQTGNRQKELA